MAPEPGLERREGEISRAARDTSHNMVIGLNGSLSYEGLTTYTHFSLLLGATAGHLVNLTRFHSDDPQGSEGISRMQSPFETNSSAGVIVASASDTHLSLARLPLDATDTSARMRVDFQPDGGGEVIVTGGSLSISHPVHGEHSRLFPLSDSDARIGALMWRDLVNELLITERLKNFASKEKAKNQVNDALEKLRLLLSAQPENVNTKNQLMNRASMFGQAVLVLTEALSEDKSEEDGRMVVQLLDSSPDGSTLLISTDSYNIGGTDMPTLHNIYMLWQDGRTTKELDVRFQRSLNGELSVVGGTIDAPEDNYFIGPETDELELPMASKELHEFIHRFAESKKVVAVLAAA